MDNSAAISLPAVDKGFLSLRPARFLGICGLFFVLAHWLPDSFFAPLNRVTAYLSGECLALLGKRAEVSGDIVSLNGFRVWIITECTPLYCIMLFGAFVFAAQASIKARVAGLLAGGAFLCSADILRVAVVTMSGSAYPALFEAVHVYLSQVAMIGLVIAASLAWLRWASRSEEKSGAFLLRAALLASVIFPLWLAANAAYMGMTDRLLAALFALAHYRLTVPSHELRVNFQTFNVVPYAALILAEQRLTLRRRIVWATAGCAILDFGHLLFRFGNVLLTACAWQPALPLTMFLNIIGEYLLPVLFWITAVRVYHWEKDTGS